MKNCATKHMEANLFKRQKHDSLMDLIVLFVHPHKYQPINQFRVAFLCVSGLTKIPKIQPEIKFLSNFIYFAKSFSDELPVQPMGGGASSQVWNLSMLGRKMWCFFAGEDAFSCNSQSLKYGASTSREKDECGVTAGWSHCRRDSTPQGKGRCFEFSEDPLIVTFHWQLVGNKVHLQYPRYNRCYGCYLKTKPVKFAGKMLGW